MPNTTPRTRTPSLPREEFIPWIKLVIRLPTSVDLPQLQQELAARNPDLAQIFGDPPRLLSPNVAVLHFLADQEHNIPDTIVAFGRVLPLTPYHDRERGWNAPNVGARAGSGSGSRGKQAANTSSSNQGTRQPLQRPDGYRSPSVGDVPDDGVGGY